MQDILIGEAHLGYVDTDVESAHDRSSNRPWVMTFAPSQVASNANDPGAMPYAATVRSPPSRVGEAKRTATRATAPGSSTPTMASTWCVHIAIVHRPWVKRKSNPVVRAASMS